MLSQYSVPDPADFIDFLIRISLLFFILIPNYLLSNMQIQKTIDLLINIELWKKNYQTIGIDPWKKYRVPFSAHCTTSRLKFLKVYFQHLHCRPPCCCWSPCCWWWHWCCWIPCCYWRPCSCLVSLQEPEFSGMGNEKGLTPGQEDFPASGNVNNCGWLEKCSCIDSGLFHPW